MSVLNCEASITGYSDQLSNAKKMKQKKQKKKQTNDVSSLSIKSSHTLLIVLNFFHHL